MDALKNMIIDTILELPAGVALKRRASHWAVVVSPVKEYRDPALLVALEKAKADNWGRA